MSQLCPLKADMRADIDLRRCGPRPDSIGLIGTQSLLGVISGRITLIAIVVIALGALVFDRGLR
jgi:hypothetical protein